MKWASAASGAGDPIGRPVAYALLPAAPRQFQQREPAVKSIAYVLADFPALSETFIGNEIRAMQQKGHRVLPIIMHRSSGPAQPDDIRLAATSPSLDDVSWGQAARAALRPSRSAWQALSFVLKQRKLPRLSLLANAMKMAALARRAGCSHVHAHFAGGATAHAIVAARWIGASISFIGHGHDIYSEPEDLPAKLAAADFVVATCEDMAGDFRSLQPGTTVGRITCGTDPERFVPAVTDEHNGRFLLIGRLVGQKGIDDLLRALALLPDEVTVDVVGEGPLRSELAAQARQLGLSEKRVNWLGARPSTWISEHAPDYLALLAPFKPDSAGQRDTGPVVIKEAMAMGLPVISTRFMGAKEMVTAETGYFFEPGDVAHLARTMAEVAGLSRTARRRIGEAARLRVVALFSLRHQAENLSALVEAA